jgi:phage recombination protein Bet
MENTTAVAQISDKVLTEYLDTFTGTNALTELEKIQFLNIAKAYGLNPFKREIYAVAYGEKVRQCSIIVGYEVSLKRAEATGLLNGWEVKYRGEGMNLSAQITIYRKDWERPFVHEVYYEESVQLKDDKPNKIWAKQPRVMLRKVAISQGFRLCFPIDLGGIPYTEDEMPIERNVTPASTGAELAEQASEPVAAASRSAPASEPAAAASQPAPASPPDPQILARRKRLLEQIKTVLGSKYGGQLIFSEEELDRYHERAVSFGDKNNIAAIEKMYEETITIREERIQLFKDAENSF